jgi:hypothetical protein
VLNVKFLVLDNLKDLLVDIKSKTDPADLPVDYREVFINGLPADGEATEKEMPTG